MRNIVPDVDAVTARSDVKLFCIGVSSGTKLLSLNVVFRNLKSQYWKSGGFYFCGIFLYFNRIFKISTGGTRKKDKNKYAADVKGKS